MPLDATYDYGPTYNLFMPNKLPILGAWVPAPEIPDKAPLKASFNPLQSYIPPAGMVSIKKIYVDENDEVRFSGGFKEDLPALITQEDLNVCIALILNGEPTLPSFSLRASDQAGMYHRAFDPNYLALTDFGRTNYFCYQIINALVFKPEAFVIATQEDFFNPEWYEPVKDLMEQLGALSKNCGMDPDRHLVRIVPEEFHCEVGGVLSQNDPTKNTWHVNTYDQNYTFEVIDTTTGETLQPISSFLDMHREAFPSLIPNFERLRQLSMVINGLYELSDAGYRMTKERHQHNATRRDDYHENFKQHGQETVCKRLFETV